jgi:UDP-2,3-diacylglucosamine hydrolase
MPPALLRIEVLNAPPAWRVIDFISDLHLQAGDPATFAAWQQYLANTPADAVFILGDLFEVWVGDDAAQAPGFEQDCARILAAAARSRDVFFMHGNRDFLLGEAFLAVSGMHVLHDPTALEFSGQRWLLSHGDALCLDDVDYQQFRLMVRSPAWQQAVLARSLEQRRTLAREIRQHGSRHTVGSTADYADVDADAARSWLSAAGATTLIHGHTHRPRAHDLGLSQGQNKVHSGSGEPDLRRVVLSDWDVGAEPPRAQVLRLSADGLQRIELTGC